jgi:alkane 1-monooxygenase
LITNLLTYQLQRHSDHHANPTRSFQSLRHFEGTPRLPAGYPAMWLAAYVPPLWFKIMDPKLVAHYRGDLSRINLDPQRRAELLAKYGQSGAAVTPQPPTPPDPETRTPAAPPGRLSASPPLRL